MTSPRQIRTGTPAGVRRELSRVYRDARTGTIAPSDGTKLAFILTALIRAMESQELEKRLSVLEARLP